MTIAAYSYYRWGVEEDLDKKMKWFSTSYVVDSDRQTFLLQLDLQRKLVPTKDNCLIFCRKNCGPIFGDGNDLWIGNNCNKEWSSCCRVGCAYND